MKRLFVIATILAFVLPGSHFLFAKDPIPSPPDTPVLGEVDPYLLETLYATSDTDASLKDVVDDARFQALVRKHGLSLFGGPMLGCVTDRGARFWVRTPGPARVAVVVGTEKSLDPPIHSNSVETQADNDFTALLDVSGLSPSKLYYYDVVVDGKRTRADDPWSFRTFPARGEKAKFDVAFGGGARYVPEKERMWDTIASYKPAAFLFLGDNLYIDLPESRSKQRVHYYRRQLRPEYQRLTAGAAIYAIWDDHDFGKNDCSGGLDPFHPPWKVPAWEVFRENWNNPYYGGGEKQPGCWFDFSIGDVDFFMTDGRYYRSFADGTMLGPVQKKWLLEKLKASRATFKVIASGTLWTELADKGGKDSWWGVEAEREEIFSLIDREKIGGVILISADRHRTDIYRIERPGGYDLYEFETSKLTNNHTHGTRPGALFSYNKSNFFGMLSFDLTKTDPEMTFRCITIDKEEVHAMTLKRSQLESE